MSVEVLKPKSPPIGTVSEAGIMRLARGLRAVCTTLEWGVFLVVALAVAAIGSVHPWAYKRLWAAAGILGLLALIRAGLAFALRRRLGLCRFCFHPSGRWLILDEESPYALRSWAFSLDRPVLPLGPLMLPGLVFLGWSLLQLVPLPPGALTTLNVTAPLSQDASAGRVPITLSETESLRGIAFLITALLVHLAASTAFDRRESRDAFAHRLRAYGLVLALFALVQRATGTTRIYWFFFPTEGGDGSNNIFGPFVNRNHFATAMLLLTAISFGLFAVALREYGRRVGRGANLRRFVVNLSSREGVSLVNAALPALACVSALIATTSRGAILAFGASLALALLALARRAQVPAWAFALAFTATALSWFGLERIEGRFEQASRESAGRTVVWSDALSRMDGRWVTGFGLNTFGLAMSRSTAWALPEGATAWRDPYETSVVTAERMGFRAIERLPGLGWYREAHNDYLQVLVEAGLVGLLVALWGGLSLLRHTRRDPWLMAAVLAVLLHELVEFSLQIPGVAILFFAVAAMRPRQTAIPGRQV
jgi:O-antigen ligase